MECSAVKVKGTPMEWSAVKVNGTTAERSVLFYTLLSWNIMVSNKKHT